MVTDNLTDTVYFSEWSLKDFPATIASVCQLLDRHGVRHGFLRHTKDYWCRDYMPIQIDGKKYVRYVYMPDYLMKGKDRAYITRPDDALADLGINPVSTSLVMDGGNVVKCPDKVIMTEKIFHENRDVQRNRVIAELERLFECEPVFLPWDVTERYGHADGIVRWVEGDRVLLTAYEESRYFSRRFREALERHFDVKVMKYTTRPRNRQLTWAYINFLQTKNVILVPVFNIKEDGEALRQIADAFPDYSGRIEAVDMSGIIRHGGGLNCISWNIRVDV